MTANPLDQPGVEDSLTSDEDRLDRLETLLSQTLNMTRAALRLRLPQMLRAEEVSEDALISEWLMLRSSLVFDPVALRDEFRISTMVASQRALWCRDYPGAEPNTCRYCGKPWRQWAGSKLDGHAACIVTDDFKQRLGDLLRSPTMTYRMVAEAIGVTSSVVRSWTMPIRSTK